MMTYDSFIAKYNGKATEYDTTDGVTTVQCVDLAKLYLSNCYGIKAKPWAWGNARDYYECFNSPSWGGYLIMRTKFTRIPNTATFVPMKGDIVVWGAGLSKYGHIAIADGVGTTSYFYSYDQNWNGKACKRVKHNYTGFLGVLRPKRTVLKDVNVRSGPGTSFKVLSEKLKGDSVTVYETKANWSRIGDGQWVHSNYINQI